jgi:glutamine amidotransferase
MDLSDLNSPEDRLAIIVTEPLTTNENWVAMQPGELRAFCGGALLV